MHESDESRTAPDLGEQLARQLEAIRDEDVPERLLVLARQLQELLRRKRGED